MLQAHNLEGGKKMKKKNILKEAGVLFIAAILVLTAIVMVPIVSAAVGPLQGSFNLEAATGANGNVGAEFVPGYVTGSSYFYTTRWAGTQIHQYEDEGTMSKEFSILGVSGLRDLAYCPVDGYLYGGAAGGTIWGFDPIDETLEVTLTGSFKCRAIAYDSDLDLFYVSNWGDPVWMVDRITGDVSPTTISLGITTSTYGFAYDNICPGGPYLWVFDQTSPSNAVIHQWKIDTTSPTYGYYTGVTHDVSADFPASGPDSKAGGLFFTTDYVTGTATLGGCLQGSPDMMFCYEVCDLPLPNNPPYDPVNTAPANGLTGLDIDTCLDWMGSDPDPGDTVDYTVWFTDDCADPTSFTSYPVGTLMQWCPPSLECGKTYCWYVTAVDNHGAPALSPPDST